MGRWLLLAGAIAAEVIGTLSLRATVDHWGWIGLVVAAYITSFALLGLTLRAGMLVGVAYAVWGAAGVALVALMGTLVFGEALTPLTLTGLAVIIAGVYLVESGAPKSRDFTGPIELPTLPESPREAS